MVRPDFDEVLPRHRLSTAKWEMEIARTGDPGILCFGTADMDFRSPPAVRRAIRDVADTGHFGYPFTPQSYYDAIVQHYARRGWTVPEEWLSSHVGIYASMQPLIEILTRPGDGVVFQSPAHHIFEELIRANGRVPRINPLAAAGDTYTMDLDHLASVVDDRTRLLLLCNPHNPVGRVWTHSELLALHEFCASRDIRILADEVYYGLLYPGVSFTPMASISHSASMNTVTVTSASKSFNLTGLTHSLVICENRKILDAYHDELKKTNVYFGGSMMGIVATEAALRHGDDWLRSLMAYVGGNLDLLRSWAAEHAPGVRVHRPEGTYFAWLDCAAWGLDDEAVVEFLESAARIVVSPGHRLGPGGTGHIRLNLACPRSTLVAGLERLGAALAHR
ncbi:MalY/PatB family protein [Pseudonocardia parietis]|uniref:cysteine-S-conjugate beta-lyase n=1 Tax=Pseudonocardia parietis TaxID=570936 RepID=A0ABS4W059_9PSEU|nr:aminotransferase class I/II-fold pyridoxal phosphate-dependent enzyme [Pseudonocardia parietis]MBP2369572.1 cystathionine beta-lyase [Pseudonocardia parietis]